MNAKQEIIDSLEGQYKGDMAPPAIFTQSGTKGQMEASGYSWPDAFYDIDKLIGLALQPSKMFGFATARIPFDIIAESVRLGCETTKGDSETQPAIIGSPWNTGEVADPPELMSAEEFISDGLTAMHIEAAERLSKEHEDLFITSAMIDSPGVAFNMLGTENLLMASLMDPDSCLKWIKAISPLMNAYGKALSEVSDGVMVIASYAEEILSPDMIETLVHPFDVELFSGIKDSFSIAHSCGESDNILEMLATAGETALSVESWKDPQGIFDRVGGKVKLVGGVNPIGVMMMGIPKDIVRSAKLFSDIGYPVICPECGVPPQTPNENLEALARYRGL